MGQARVQLGRESHETSYLTRGAMGVRVDGVDKIGYCQSDSQPRHLGRRVLSDILGMQELIGLRGIAQLARSVRLVDKDLKASPDDQVLFKRFSLLGEDSRLEEWHILLGHLNGALAGCLYAGVMLDSSKFLASRYCEWAYIADLDRSTFEVYRGFQEKAHNKGRYHNLPRQSSFYPVALVGVYSLDTIPRDWLLDLLESL